MYDCLKKNKKVVNGSPTGSGKTVLSYYMMQQLRREHGQDVKMVVVGPSSLEANKSGTGPLTSPWTREGLKYKEDHIFITYDSIRGSTPSRNVSTAIYSVRGGRTLSHLEEIHDCMNSPDDFQWYNDQEEELYGQDIDERDPDPDQFSYTNYCGLIVRKDIRKVPDPESRRIRTSPKSTKPQYEHVFSPSKWWMQFCVKNIVLLVIDESHYAKNDSVQNNAVGALIRGISRASIVRPDGASYYMWLSSTPMVKECQAANYFKLMGFSNPILNGDMFVSSGVRSLYDCFVEACVYNKAKAVEIGLDGKVVYLRSNDRYVASRAGVANPARTTFAFWLECVLSQIQFVIVSMTARQCWNAFLDIHDPHDRALFRQAHAKLKRSKLLAEKGQADQAMKLMSEGHLLTDAGMVGSITRKAIEGLNKHAERRFVLAFTLIESVDRCIEMLKEAGFDYHVVGRVAGINKTSFDLDKKRCASRNAQAIYDFQTDKIKVIVGTFALLCTGLDLHDLQGQRPRYTYFPGIYDITVEQQIAGRTDRYGSRSVPQIFVCYPKKMGADIQKIYTSGVQKSIIMTKTLEAIRRENLSESDLRFYRSVIRLPGAYDRYIELPEGCEDMSYLLDYPIYNRKTDTYYPDKDKHGFIEIDDVEGRLDYKDTSKMIEYLMEICYDCKDVNAVPGIVFSTPMPSSFDPTQTKSKTESKTGEQQDVQVGSSSSKQEE
ncbi:Hypothetical protein POVR2_LOCUS393 [uncultured virus]|nr:Hypothetical protein POVR2_LOCUS393 [uncultured virus]